MGYIKSFRVNIIETEISHPGIHVGCPRERFLAINSGKLSAFLQAYLNAYYTQSIKKLGSAELSLIAKFLHGRELWKFLKWQFRKF